MKVIIAGSRTFSDYTLLHQKCDEIINTPAEIVSGTARGADRLGERYAIEKGCPIKKFPADWDNLGRSAGYLRNEEMAKYADTLIAFWDGTSKGTSHMIVLATKHNLKVHIVKY